MYLTPLQRQQFGIDIPVPKDDKSLRHEESRQQIACVEWFSYQYPSYRGLLYAIPNGGKRSKVESKIMKAEGVRSGAFDQNLALPRGRYHGMYIEQKIDSPNSKMSENQWDFMLDVMGQGYHVAVVWDKTMFIEAIEWYMALGPFNANEKNHPNK